MFDGHITLSFGRGNVTLINKKTANNSPTPNNITPDSTTQYLEGTYTVSGNTATFSGDITQSYLSGEINGSVLTVHISGRNATTTYTLVE